MKAMKSYKITVNGQSYDVTVEEMGGSGSVSPAAQPAPRAAAPVQAAPAAASAPVRERGAAGAVQVKSPMPGTLLSYKVAAGQAVKQGDVLLILEAMKMENEIVAPVSGVVAALCASEGASVNTGDVLAELG
jgi:glutaconyl-CoA/methylmalonyl-CoA decarboxylase subunit gamma